MEPMEQWIKKYYNRRVSSMPGSSITVVYEPKQNDIPPPPGSAEQRMPWRSTIYGGTAAISLLLIIGSMLTA